MFDAVAVMNDTDFDLIRDSCGWLPGLGLNKKNAVSAQNNFIIT
ncbi:hypothetical protein TcasGA2_TC033534 [Tribolium castaneum]|uniref:Uncharacterized protein n=1 Tax=Tribolium castaneum TaxID=7070 RepID=A0A139WG27_TRICA|nr:hypothetical protein TcasGA2_TC033534 [Tribolium castaneum]